MDFSQSLVEHVRAGYQVIYVVTREESQATAAIIEAATQLSKWREERELDDKSSAVAVLEYELLQGGCVSLIGGESKKKPLQDQEMSDGMKMTPAAAVQWMAQEGQLRPSFDHAFLILKDFHNYQESAETRRTIRANYANQAYNTSKHHRVLILMQPFRKLAADLSGLIVDIPFELPKVRELEDIVRRVSGNDVPPEVSYRLAHDLQGLTRLEAEDCLCLSRIRSPGAMDSRLSAQVQKVKSGILGQEGILKYVSPEEIPDSSSLGGYDAMFKFVDRQAMAYTREAEAVKLDLPKGISFFGVPGTGKSSACRVLSRRLNLPLVLFDFSAVFAAHVGESEANLREVLRKVSAINGCVLMVDEVDKAIGRAEMASGDSGVGRRLLGQMLTWMWNKKDRTYVVFSLNRPENVPPELLRRGRIDEMFYVGLPSPAERRNILEIHLKLRGIDPGRYGRDEWDQLEIESDKLVGVELEEAVKRARSEAFQVSYIRGLLDSLPRLSGEEKEQVNRKISSYGRDSQLAALSLSEEGLEPANAAVPTYTQLIESVKVLARNPISQVHADALASIVEHGAKYGRSVSEETSPIPARRNRRHVS